MIIEIDITRPSPVVQYELLVPLRPLVLGVPSQHALQAHAYALHILHRRPALHAKQIQTNDAVRVNVWMHGYWAVGAGKEGHFWGFWADVSQWWGGRGKEREQL